MRKDILNRNFVAFVLALAMVLAVSISAYAAPDDAVVQVSVTDPRNGVTVSEFLSNSKYGSEVWISASAIDTKPVDGDKPVATGMVLHTDASTTQTLVVPGDIMGSGVITLSQLVRLVDCFKHGSLKGVYLLAGDMNGNGQLDLSDLIAVVGLLNGNSTPLEPSQPSEPSGLNEAEVTSRLEQAAYLLAGSVLYSVRDRTYADGIDYSTIVNGLYDYKEVEETPDEYPSEFIKRHKKGFVLSIQNALDAIRSDMNPELTYYYPYAKVRDLAIALIGSQGSVDTRKPPYPPGQDIANGYGPPGIRDITLIEGDPASLGGLHLFECKKWNKETFRVLLETEEASDSPFGFHVKGIKRVAKSYTIPEEAPAM